jgi:hypothetical protein
MSGYIDNEYRDLLHPFEVKFILKCHKTRQRSDAVLFCRASVAAMPNSAAETLAPSRLSGEAMARRLGGSSAGGSNL